MCVVLSQNKTMFVCVCGSHSANAWLLMFFRSSWVTMGLYNTHTHTGFVDREIKIVYSFML